MGTSVKMQKKYTHYNRRARKNKNGELSATYYTSERRI